MDEKIMTTVAAEAAQIMGDWATDARVLIV